MQATTTVLRLNWQAFDARCLERGWERAQDRAAALGVSEAMISRARQINWPASPRLVAACTRVFGADSYADLFRVVQP